MRFKRDGMNMVAPQKTKKARHPACDTWPCELRERRSVSQVQRMSGKAIRPFTGQMPGLRFHGTTVTTTLGHCFLVCRCECQVLTRVVHM